MTPRGLPMLLLVGALMASAFPLIEVTVGAFGVFPLMATRLLVAAALLSVVMAALRPAAGARRPPAAWLVLGILNAALPFALIASAQRVVPSALASMLIATAPSITAVLVSVRTHRAPHATQIAGLLVGLAGVGMIGSWSYGELGLAALPAGALLLAAACSYAVGALYTQTRFADVDRVHVARGTFLSGGVVLLPLALLDMPASVPGGSAWLAFGALASVSTVGGFLLYFGMIRRHGAQATSLVAYLLPAFGTLYGVLLLGETVGPGALAGIGTVLLGTAITTFPRLSNPRIAPRGRTRPPGAHPKGTTMLHLYSMERMTADRHRDLETMALQRRLMREGRSERLAPSRTEPGRAEAGRGILGFLRSRLRGSRNAAIDRRAEGRARERASGPVRAAGPAWGEMSRGRSR